MSTYWMLCGRKLMRGSMKRLNIAATVLFLTVPLRPAAAVSPSPSWNNSLTVFAALLASNWACLPGAFSDGEGLGCLAPRVGEERAVTWLASVKELTRNDPRSIREGTFRVEMLWEVVAVRPVATEPGIICVAVTVLAYPRNEPTILRQWETLAPGARTVFSGDLRGVIGGVVTKDGGCINPLVFVENAEPRAK
jgi:hypothetical protein